MSEIQPEPCNCAALRQATRHVTRLYDEALAPCGLGLNQYSILSKLRRFGPVTIQDLADRLVMDRSTLGHLIRPLETRGLAAVATAEKDRRQRIVSLTDEGRALMARAQPYWAEAEQKFERAYGADHARVLRTMLKDVATADFNRVST